jgi:hypothetical protein
VQLSIEPATRAVALIERGIKHMRLDRFAAAVIDHEEATEIAKRLGPEELARALCWESQARMEAGQLQLAARRLDEAQRIADRSTGIDLWGQDTLRADLAVMSGQPAEALEHYARSMELAQRRGNQLQVFSDLGGLADALAMNGNDAEAVQVSGIGAGHIADVGGIEGPVVWHIQGRDFVAEAAERLGPAAADEHRARGRAVDAGYRVTRACAIARAQNAVAA